MQRPDPDLSKAVSDLHHKTTALEQRMMDAFNREKIVLLFASWFVTVLGIVALLGGYVSLEAVEERIDRSLEDARLTTQRAERLIETALDDTRPNAISEFEPLATTTAGQAYAIIELPRNILSEQMSSVTLTIAFPFRGRIEGDPGILVGYEYELRGPIIDLLSGEKNGVGAILASRQFSIDSTGVGDGVRVSKDGPFQFSVSYRRNFDSSGSAIAEICAFIESNEVAGVISARPIFLDIDTQPQVKDFEFVLASTPGFQCNDGPVIEPVVRVDDSPSENDTVE